MKKFSLFSSLAAAATVAAVLLLGSCENPSDTEKSTPVDPATLKNITSFSFASPAAAGTVSGSTIAVTVPVGTDRTALVATFTTDGESVKVGEVTQVSGTTANNFTNPVTYTVTAKDASTKTYVVTVTEQTAPTVDLSKIWIEMEIKPYTNRTAGSADYYVDCYIDDEAGTDFRNVVLKVNGIVIPYYGLEDGEYNYFKTIGNLSVGSTVSITLQDAKLGAHSWSTTIPQSIETFTINPEFQAGVEATANSYDVSWNSIPNVQGYVSYLGYWYSTEQGMSRTGRGTYTTGLQCSFLKSNPGYTEFFMDWMYIRVEAQKLVMLTDFYNGSKIISVGPYDNIKTNYVPAD